jgi:hypothetical protein
MPMNFAEKVKVTLHLCTALIDAVAEAGSCGAPRGIMYLGFMSHGYSLGEYQIIEEMCIESGRIEKIGDLLFIIA